MIKNLSKVLLLAFIFGFALLFPGQQAKAADSIDLWWPVENVKLTETQPFKALLNGSDLTSYDMFWQVDNGQFNNMYNSYTDYPHKEATVDLTSWTWRKNKTYTVKFTAMDFGGKVLATKTVRFYANFDDNADKAPAPVVAAPAPTTSSSHSSGSVTAPSTNTSSGSAASTGGKKTPIVKSGTVTNAGPEHYAVEAPVTAPAPVDIIVTPVPTVSTSETIISPVDNANLTGLVDFSARLDNTESTKYLMYWQVDGDRLNGMTNAADGSRKVASVDVDLWTWKDAGPYSVTFIAQDLSGKEVARKSVTVMVNNPNVVSSGVSSGLTSTVTIVPPPVVAPVVEASAQEPLIVPAPAQTSTPATTTDAVIVAPTTETQTPAAVTSTEQNNQSNQNNPSNTSNSSTTTDTTNNAATSSAVTVTPSPAPATNETVSSSGNPFANAKFYVNPNSNAKRQADEWRSSRPQDAALMDKIAANPDAKWLGNWNGNIKDDTKAYVNEATKNGAIPVMIAYNIPGRDCGSYSAGGAENADHYKSWINGLADGIGNKKAAVILEPDALAGITCLDNQGQASRLALLNYAVDKLKSLGNTSVYLDAGHSNWIGAEDMSTRLKNAGIAKADGFALNVSNYGWTNDQVTYGTKLSGLVGGKHFVVDTSRNGQGPLGSEWCNPQGRGLGHAATTNTGNSLVDAFMWLKNPGESDGTCNGGPSAGVWWPDYALGLAQKAE